MLLFEQQWRHDYADATILGNFSIVKKLDVITNFVLFFEFSSTCEGAISAGIN